MILKNINLIIIPLLNILDLHLIKILKLSWPTMVLLKFKMSSNNKNNNKRSSLRKDLTLKRIKKHSLTQKVLISKIKVNVLEYRNNS
jgi:hypothetical protein